MAGLPHASFLSQSNRIETMPLNHEQRTRLANTLARANAAEKAQHVFKVDDTLDTQYLADLIANRDDVYHELDDLWQSFAPTYNETKVKVNRRWVVEYLEIQLHKLKEMDNLPDTEYKERVTAVYTQLNRFYYSVI